MHDHLNDICDGCLRVPPHFGGLERGEGLKIHKIPKYQSPITSNKGLCYKIRPYTDTLAMTTANNSPEGKD